MSPKAVAVVTVLNWVLLGTAEQPVAVGPGAVGDQEPPPQMGDFLGPSSPPPLLGSVPSSSLAGSISQGGTGDGAKVTAEGTWQCSCVLGTAEWLVSAPTPCGDAWWGALPQPLPGQVVLVVAELAMFRWLSHCLTGLVGAWVTFAGTFQPL